MGKRIEAIKKLQQSTPQEVMAGYLWNFVVNSKDQFWKTKYYDQTAYFELNHDNDAYMIKGSYETVTGIVRNIDPVINKSIAIDDMRIPLSDVVRIECSAIPDYAMD